MKNEQCGKSGKYRKEIPFFVPQQQQQRRFIISIIDVNGVEGEKKKKNTELEKTVAGRTFQLTRKRGHRTGGGGGNVSR